MVGTGASTFLQHEKYVDNTPRHFLPELCASEWHAREINENACKREGGGAASDQTAHAHS